MTEGEELMGQAQRRRVYVPRDAAALAVGADAVAAALAGHADVVRTGRAACTGWNR